MWFMFLYKQVKKWFVVTLGTLLLSPLCSPAALCDTMTGGAAAAIPSPSGIALNPGNLAFVEDSFFDISPRIFEINKVSIRYPGFDTITSNQKGISPLAALSFAPRTGDEKKSNFRVLLNELVPPISVPFTLKGLPVLILDNLTTFDVKTTVNIRGAIGGAVSLRLGSRFGMGLSGNYRSAALENNLRVRGESADLATLSASVDLASVTVGMRFIAIPDRLALGLSTVAFASQKLENSIEGDIVNAAGNIVPPTALETTQILKSVLVGSHLIINPYVSVRLDFLYSRANPDEQRFSLVDLENQPLESYDSVSVRVGTKIWTSYSNVFSLGYTYEPASVGSGQRGPGTETGFGIQDYVLVLAGIDELKPYHRVVAGGGKSFGFEKGIAHWNAMVGIAYQIATLGIDEEGEQPGAFAQQKFFFPGQLTYRF
jgi:hypothetical protein